MYISSIQKSAVDETWFVSRLFVILQFLQSISCAVLQYIKACKCIRSYDLCCASLFLSLFFTVKVEEPCNIVNPINMFSCIPQTNGCVVPVLALISGRCVKRWFVWIRAPAISVHEIQETFISLLSVECNPVKTRRPACSAVQLYQIWNFRGVRLRIRLI